MNVGMPIVFKKLYSLNGSVERCENQFADVVQYYCEECSQKFVAKWDERANPINPWIARGDNVYCPFCGKHHKREDQLVVSPGKFIPSDLQIQLQAFKGKVKVIVKASIFSFGKQFSYKAGTVREVFDFDVLNRRCTFSKETRICGSEVTKTTLNCGHPLNASWVKNSVLWYLMYGSRIIKENRSTLVSFNRLLREELTKRIIQRDGRSPLGGSLYHGKSYRFGQLLLTEMANYMARVIVPEMENQDRVLAHAFENETDPLWDFVKTDSLTSETWGCDSIGGFLKDCGILDTKLARSEALRSPRLLEYLAPIYETISNPNLQMRMYQAAKLRCFSNKKTIYSVFLPWLCRVYGEKAAVRFMETKSDSEIQDCCRMIADLLPQTLEKIEGEDRPRLRELHDRLVDVLRKQKVADYLFEIPEAIQRRVAMQVESFQFMLPERRHELFNWGDSLNICVGSVSAYGENMAKGKTLLIGVADDKGKLCACLEIDQAKRSIVQAKRKGNKPVSSDTVVNQAVLDWATKSEFLISTKDVADRSSNVSLVATA